MAQLSMSRLKLDKGCRILERKAKSQQVGEEKDKYQEEMREKVQEQRYFIHDFH